MARLFVGNLPFKASEQDVLAFFTNSGVNVDSVNLMRDRFTGEARGFGFVDLDESQTQHAIQACNGRDFMGRSVVVNEARPMAERGERGGGGGGGGGDRPRGGGRGGPRGGGGGRDQGNRW